MMIGLALKQRTDTSPGVGRDATGMRTAQTMNMQHISTTAVDRHTGALCKPHFLSEAILFHLFSLFSSFFFLFQITAFICLAYRKQGPQTLAESTVSLRDLNEGVLA